MAPWFSVCMRPKFSAVGAPLEIGTPAWFRPGSNTARAFAPARGRSNQATIPMTIGLIFMTISPSAGGFPDGLLTMVVTSGSVNAPRTSATPATMSSRASHS